MWGPKQMKVGHAEAGDISSLGVELMFLGLCFLGLTTTLAPGFCTANSLFICGCGSPARESAVALALIGQNQAVAPALIGQNQAVALALIGQNHAVALAQIRQNQAAASAQIGQNQAVALAQIGQNQAVALAQIGQNQAVAPAQIGKTWTTAVALSALRVSSEWPQGSLAERAGFNNGRNLLLQRQESLAPSPTTPLHLKTECTHLQLQACLREHPPSYTTV